MEAWIRAFDSPLLYKHFDMIQNSAYWEGLTKSYGSYGTTQDKSKRFNSDFTFEELEIGTKVWFVVCDTESTIIEKSSNTIRTYNLTNQKNRYKTGAKDADGEVQSGKLKGRNASNWYTLEEFNRTFKRI